MMYKHAKVDMVDLDDRDFTTQKWKINNEKTKILTVIIYYRTPLSLCAIIKYISISG